MPLTRPPDTPQHPLELLGRHRLPSPPAPLLLGAGDELGAEPLVEAMVSQAAADRGRAATDRANVAREHARLEAELKVAHLDDLTGAYRREIGQLALSHEIDRARRSDGRFVLTPDRPRLGRRDRSRA